MNFLKCYLIARNVAVRQEQAAKNEKNISEQQRNSSSLVDPFHVSIYITKC
jgi:hypothetical protein